MVFSQDGMNSPRRSGLLLSVGGHALIALAAVLATLHFHRVHTVYRDSRCCSAALYWTGSAGADTPKDKPLAQSRRLRSSPRPTPTTISNASPRTFTRAPQSVPGMTGTPQQSTIGTGAGTDNTEPPFPIYFPRPPVADRSLLPAVEQKIIVMVTISPLGDVTDEKLTQGLGNALDQAVLDTVKGWRFQPATVNGTAIASTEQLVFPFSRTNGADDGVTNPT